MDYLEKFRDEVGDAIREFDAKVAKAGFKLTEFTEDADSEDEFGVAYSNSILEISVYIKIVAGNRGTNSESYILNAQLSILDALTVGEGQTLPSSIVSVYTTNINDEDALIKKLSEASEKILNAVKPIVEWYFDVSGEYGKVKMFVEKRGVNNLVRALAGDFDIDKGTGEVY